jgi:glyoxylase-like metal-dependent hydrolase (beta-lactamase superfamily II)
MFLERIENGPFFVNTYLLGCTKTRQGILIDPGHEPERIAARMAASGLTFTAIVNTHGHIDHVASAKHFQDELGIPFRMHAADEYFLMALEETCRFYGLPVVSPPRLDESLSAGGEFSVGEIRVLLRHAPGHSPGSLIFDLGEEMIVGDVVFEGSIGRTDLPLGNHDELLRSIGREVLVKPDAVTLHPGHGPSTTVGRERRSNPFLT